jgi:uncharacterized membrane protein YhdT
MAGMPVSSYLPPEIKGIAERPRWVECHDQYPFVINGLEASPLVTI